MLGSALDSHTCTAAANSGLMTVINMPGLSGLGSNAIPKDFALRLIDLLTVMT
jgi:hypothetical protein